MTAMSADHVARVVDFLQEKKRRTDDVSLNDVMHLAEVMTDSFREHLVEFEPAVHSELTEIGGEIAKLKQEIAQLRPTDMTQTRIPGAGQELDAIVESTEDATNRIMEAAECIMGSQEADPEKYKTIVNDKMIEIFEACTFQDITGQRIAKVVSTLNYIDQRVSEFVERLNVVEEGDAPPAEETEEERRQRELILHGPQGKGEGVCQDDIDQMLFGESDQLDIDKLFP
ncbi:MAG: protein phosphatase CheZ [Stappiaceae bacterium]